jgi:hypothetical protein
MRNAPGAATTTCTSSRSGSTASARSLSTSFHVPYPVGKGYLPDPSTLPENAFSDRATESDDCWTFGRPLNRVEAAAFSVDEIVRGLKAALQQITQAGEQPWPSWTPTKTDSTSTT